MAIYKSDLAYVHHVAYSDLSRAVAPWLGHQLRRRSHANGLLVDLGCGSGVLAAAMVRQGYHVMGVDASAAMIALARRTAPNARFVTGSLFHTRVPSCCAVTTIGEALNYVAAGRGAPSRLPPLFRRIYRALCPGGIFVFDILERPVTPQLAPICHHRQGRDWAVLMKVDAPRSPSLLERRITVFRKGGGGDGGGGAYRRSFETHTIRLYDRSALQRQLRDTGFRVRTFRAYGTTRLLPSRIGFLASKPV